MKEIEAVEFDLARIRSRNKVLMNENRELKKRLAADLAIVMNDEQVQQQEERDQLRGERDKAVTALQAADSLLDGIRDHDHKRFGVFCFSRSNPVHLHVKDLLKRIDGGGGEATNACDQ